MVNYHNKTFRAVPGTSTGDVNAETVFIYRQDENIVTASYAGGDIVSGHLMGIVKDDDSLDMRYHHVTEAGEIKTGTCITVPEIAENGTIILHEKWQWTCGDMSKGESTLEEI